VRLSQNPWLELPSQPPYVLPVDRSAVETFNAKARPDVFLHLQLIPEPFLGDPDAPVVLLGLNPGYTPEKDDEHHRDPAFVQRSRDNLTHRPSQYPFFLVNPAITAPGAGYWRSKLGYLIKEFNAETVARSFLCVEFTPYHSVKFGFRRRLTSQEYSFNLVRRALSRSAIVIVMRARSEWLKALPELIKYDRIYRVNSFQNPYVTPAN